MTLVALFAMVIVWLVLVKKICSMLEARHSDIYEAMGRPGLFVRNNPASTLSLLNFIIVREHRGLGDKDLGYLSDFMLVFFALYVLLFLGLAVNMPNSGS